MFDKKQNIFQYSILHVSLQWKRIIYNALNNNCVGCHLQYREKAETTALVKGDLK